MQYIFKDGDIGEYPVESFQVCLYDLELNNGWCFDERFISPERLNYHALSYIETEENKEDRIRKRMFANMKNGDVYELILRKVDKDEDLGVFSK